MVRQHRTTAAVAITLALTASLAPTASADPAPLARAEAAITATHGSAPVRPNPDQQTATPPITHPGPCSEVCSGGAGHLRIDQSAGRDAQQVRSNASAAAPPARRPRSCASSLTPAALTGETPESAPPRPSSCSELDSPPPAQRQPAATARPRTARDRNQLTPTNRPKQASDNQPCAVATICGTPLAPAGRSGLRWSPLGSPSPWPRPALFVPSLHRRLGVRGRLARRYDPLPLWNRNLTHPTWTSNRAWPRSN